MLPFAFSEPVRTDRLAIRRIEADDLDDMYAYQRRADVCQYLLTGPRTLDELRERIATYMSATELAGDGDFWQLAVELPAAAGQRSRVIGELYFKVASVELMTAEIGWVFNPDFHGRGFATEAATALMRLAFGELGLHRLLANLDPRNSASIALCLRLGMRHEAHFVKDLKVRGRWEDTGIYAILEEEWAAR